MPSVWRWISHEVRALANAGNSLVQVVHWALDCLERLAAGLGGHHQRLPLLNCTLGPRGEWLHERWDRLLLALVEQQVL
jgi:hypothetical protein